MARFAAGRLFVSPESYRFLGRLISGLRWTTILAVLLLTVLQPTTGRTGLPTWVPILLFAGYSLVSDLVRLRLPTVRSFAAMAILDLPVAGLVYFLGTERGSVFFVLFFMTVVSAAATLNLQGGLLYAGAVGIIMLAVHLLLPISAAGQEPLQELAARLVLLALVAVATGLLARRLALQEARTLTVSDAAVRLQERDQFRADFIATVSHDLRTPLTAARAGVGLLETSAAERLREDELELLHNVRRNIITLGRLTDNLLAYNQLEAGGLLLSREPFDLRSVVMASVATVQPLLHDKEQTLTTDLPDPLPVDGDQRGLQQVLVNVLANAHGHTLAGTAIAIQGRVSSGEVVLRVHDTGPGIPSEELEAIFRRSYRLSTTSSGSGLGLAIARAIVEPHGGRIWAESTAGDGTTFIVALPLHIGSEDL